jgi:hypothetical protein
MTVNIFDLTDSWNNASVRFDAIRMNVSDAASAGDSKLIDLLLGGESRFNVGKNVTTARGALQVGNVGGNFVELHATAAGGQFASVVCDGPDQHINLSVHSKGGGGVLLYANDGLQLAAAGPAGTTRYLVLTGASGTDNPQINAGGGGKVQIPDLVMVGTPVAPTPPIADNSTRVATTNFIKAQLYVQAAPPTNFNQLAGFADPIDGTLIQGINMPNNGLKKVGPNLLLSDDLQALEDLTGTNTIYYRSGLSIWTEVTIGAGLLFTGGTLSAVATGAEAPANAEYITASANPQLSAERVLTDTATITWDFSTPGEAKATSIAGGGNVSNVGTPTSGQFARWTSATTIEGISPAAALTAIGAQPLDAELTAFAGLTPTANHVAYFTGVGAMASVVTTNFSRGLWANNDAPTWLTALGAAPLASPAFTGTPTSPTPAGTDSSARIATTAFVKGLGYVTSADLSTTLAGYQPLDGDLTAIAALTGINQIYYRSAADTWSQVVIGANLTFTGGVLAATGGGGGGDVFLAGNQVFTGTNAFTNAMAVGGNGTFPESSATFKMQLVNAHEIQGWWSADASGAFRNFYKSRSATQGTHTIVQNDDRLGSIQFAGSDGTAFVTAAGIIVDVSGSPASGSVPGKMEFRTRSAGGVLDTRMTLTSTGPLLIGANAASPQGVAHLLQVDAVSSLGVTIGRWVNGTGGPVLDLRKSRGGTVGNRGVISSGDILGEVAYYGDDGTNWVSGAAVRAVAEAAPASSFVDTSLRFLTFKTGLGYTEKVRIYPSGALVAPPTIADPGYGNIAANAFTVRQGGDNLGQGFTVYNTAGDAATYMLICGGSNPNDPRSFGVVTNYPGTGLVVYNAGDFANAIARFVPGGCQLKGTTTNDNAGIGYVGEYKENAWNSTAVAANTSQVIGQVNLGAGDWDVWVNGYVIGGAASNGVSLGLNTVAATLPGGIGQTASTTAYASGIALLTVQSRFSMSATGNVYVNVLTGAAAAATFTGIVCARRVR